MTKRIQIFSWLLLPPPDDCSDLDLRSWRQSVRDIFNFQTWIRSSARFHIRQSVAASHGIIDEIERVQFIRDQIINIATDHKISRTVAARLMRDAETSVKNLGPIVWENSVVHHYRHCGQTWTDETDISACPTCLIVTRPTHSRRV